MKRKCCICGIVYGEKEPLEDQSITSGYCDKCFNKEMERISMIKWERKVRKREVVDNGKQTQNQ